MNIKTAIVFLLLIPSAHASNWTKADTAREVVFQTLMVADWLQTRDISVNNCRVLTELKPGQRCWEEANPILGPSPTLDEVNTYFAVTMLGHYLVSRMLKPKYRKYWQYAWIAIEGGVVANNLQVGVGFRF